MLTSWAGQYGCSDMVIQKDVAVQKNKEPKKTGYNYLCWTLYGIKTFTEGAKDVLKLMVAYPHSLIAGCFRQSGNLRLWLYINTINETKWNNNQISKKTNWMYRGHSNYDEAFDF